jgi:hypothetical protein
MKTPKDIYNEAHAESIKTMGVASSQLMLGYLTARVAELENELSAYQVPSPESGHIQTAFVHQGVHLVAEWSGSGDDMDVHYLWLGSDDVLDLVSTDDGDVPDWVFDAIDSDNEESNLSHQLHIAGY